MVFSPGCLKWIDHINLHKILLTLLSINFTLRYGETSLPRSFNLSREHVGVRFEPPSTILQKYRYKRENLQVIIPIIAQKFGTIAIRDASTTLPKGSSLEALNDSIWLIPGIVAEHNRNHPEIFTECIIAFRENIREEKNHMNSLETAKYVADFANAIYPGTVKIIARQGEWILNWDNISMNLQAASKFLKSSSENVSSTDYKLAVNMENFDCKKIRAIISSSPSSTSATLEFADVVVPHIWDTLKKDNLNPLERHNILLAQIRECEDSLEKLKPTPMEIIPRVGCNAPKNRDFLEISMLLQCWQLMSDWAKENNRRVIMDYPFDQFHISGWWRMTPEHIKWVNASSFLERATEDVPCLAVGAETVVYFDHRVRYHQHSSFYSEKEINTMLQLVSSRFSTILLSSDAAHFNSTESSTTYVAEKVAKFNKGNTENNPIKNQLRVISSFHCDDNQTSSYQDRKGSRCSSFQATLKSAQLANNIFPGTVISIVYDKFEGVAQNITNVMQTLANEIYLQSESTKLGAILDMNTCEFVRNDFQLVSEWISVLIVEITGSVVPYSMDLHPDSSLNRLISNWTECRERFSEKYPNVEFQLAVDCSKVVAPTAHSKYSSESIVRCWQIVSEWGLKNKIEVILFSAFDTHLDYQHVKVGWWRLRSKSEIDIKLSSFVEVTEDVEWDNSIYCNQTATPSMAVSSQVDCESNSMSISVILPIICLILILTAQCTLFVYLHGCNWKLFQRSILDNSQELQVFDE